MKSKIVVLVSGNGSNLERIISATDSGEIPGAEVSLVVADRPCFALTRAQRHGIRAHLLPRSENWSSGLQAILPDDTDLIVLAGFLSILDADFCEKYHRKIINLHPALLPKFGGKGMWGKFVHEAVLAAGETESGVSVHFVTAGIDEGEIIMQKSFPLDEHESFQSLEEKIRAAEFEILPKAIAKVLAQHERQDKPE